MTVVAGMTLLVVLIFFLMIILGIQMQINSLGKRVEEILRRMDRLGK